MVLGTRRLRDARQAERAMTEHVRDVAAMTSQLQRHKPVPRKDRAVPLDAQNAARATSPYWTTIRRIGSRTAIECDAPFGPVMGRAVYSLFAVID